MPTPFDTNFTSNDGNLNSEIRVVGAGNTVITFGDDKLVILCDSVSDSAPPLAITTPEQVQGIGDQRPVAIIPSTVQKAGTLTLKFYEKYPSVTEGFTFWQQTLKHCGFHDLDNIYSIAALMAYQRTNPTFLGSMNVKMYFTNPSYSTSGKRTADSYVVKSFENPVITNVDQNESITNQSIIKTGTMTIMYTHNIWSQGGQTTSSGSSDLSVVSLSGR